MENQAETSELLHRIGELLGRFGVAGRVVVEGCDLVLVGHGPRVRLDVAGELEGFRTCSEAERHAIAERLARELSARRRAVSPSIAPKSRRIVEWLRLIPGILVMALGCYGAWQWLGKPAKSAVGQLPRSGSSESVASSSTPLGAIVASKSQGTHGGESPLARCKAVRARITTGGSISQLDVDGWVVDLMLLSHLPGLTPESDKLAGFFKRESNGALHVAWGDEPSFSLPDSPGLRVQVVREPLTTVVPGTHSGVRISFFGKYVPFFFDETERLKYVRMAAALYDATSSSHGALYARCEDGGSHHLGAWFRGADFGGASTSLVASMGLYAEVPHLSGVGLGGDPLEQRRALSSFQERTKKFTKERLTLLLADDGGMLAARPGQWAAITFPFSDGNRASRASLKIATSAGVGPTRR